MASQPLWPFLCSRGFTLTLHGCSALCSFPSLPPRRGWQRRERCPQSFRPRITRQPVWVGTPGHRRARRGSLSPSSILLHGPYEMPQEYACSSPGRNIPLTGALLGSAARAVGRPPRASAGDGFRLAAGGAHCRVLPPAHPAPSPSSHSSRKHHAACVRCGRCQRSRPPPRGHPAATRPGQAQ
jgi:hypothetical protein